MQFKNLPVCFFKLNSPFVILFPPCTVLAVIRTLLLEHIIRTFIFININYTFLCHALCFEFYSVSNSQVVVVLAGNGLITLCPFLYFQLVDMVLL